MDHAESLAKVLLETAFAGSRMNYRGNQSAGEHDFDLHYADGHVAAVEVPASVDQEIEKTSAAIQSTRKGGPKIKTGSARMSGTFTQQHHWCGGG